MTKMQIYNLNTLHLQYHLWVRKREREKMSIYIYAVCAAAVTAGETIIISRKKKIKNHFHHLHSTPRGIKESERYTYMRLKQDIQE